MDDLVCKACLKYQPERAAWAYARRHLRPRGQLIAMVSSGCAVPFEFPTFSQGDLEQLIREAAARHSA